MADMIMIGFPTFSNDAPQPKCGYPAFRGYIGTKNIEHPRRRRSLGGDDGTLGPRNSAVPHLGLTARDTPSDDTRLIVSPFDWHNATELCLHPNSWGPDFVSLSEGVHCDMTTREITPLCDAPRANQEECFELPLDNVEHGGNSKRDGDKGGKKYSKIVRWGE